MPEPRGMKADPSNPFHQASFYVEWVKYGRAPGKLVGATFEEIEADVARLLEDAEVTSMTAAELVETCDYYAESYALLFGIRRLVTKTMFLDGVMHGIAFAAGLKGEPRP
jgi:hypothetical protein